MNLEAEFIYLYPNFLQNLFVTDFAAEFLGEKKKHWIRVWKKKSESGAQYSLNGLVGQVNALEFVNDLLFAGVEVNTFAISLYF